MLHARKQTRCKLPFHAYFRKKSTIAKTHANRDCRSANRDETCRVFCGPSQVSGTDLQHHRSRGLVAGHKIRFLADEKWLTKSKKYSSDVIFDPNRELFSSEWPPHCALQLCKPTLVGNSHSFWQRIRNDHLSRNHQKSIWKSTFPSNNPVGTSQTPFWIPKER